ncbi:hypothetical protein [Desulfocicer niacini]
MAEQNTHFIHAFRQMWGNYPEVALLLNQKHEIVAVNKVAQGLGIEPGINCFSLNGTDRMCKGCKAPLMHKQGKAQRQVLHKDPIGILDSYWIPVDDSDGLYVHFANNITQWAKSAKVSGTKDASPVSIKDVLTI